MKVLALGGCGGMGRFAVRTALTFDFVEQVIIADRDGEAAATAAEACGSKATHEEIDVQDQGRLVQLIRKADVVLADVGPYYRFGTPVLQAAIEAKRDYIDINDDWEPTLEMLSLDREARRAGITALIGMGASPGQSNMLAVKAASLLDSVDALITGWGVGEEVADRSQGTEADRSSQAPSAAIVHWLHQLTGNIRYLQDGQFVDVPPMQPVELDYPGIGSGRAYTVGHPEPLTLPRYLPGIRNSCNVMVISESLAGFLRQLTTEVDAGRMTVDEAAGMVAGSTGDLPEDVSLAESGESGRPQLPELFAYAKGLKDGKSASIGVTVSAGVGGGMGGATGVPQAIGLKMLAEGKITRKGVFSPEADVDPDDFFDELGPLCSPPCVGSKDMLIVTSSLN